MYIDMFVDLKVHHGGIMCHTPFSYVDGDIHDVPGYDVDFFNKWELKELVNDFKYWYNVSAEHEQVIPLNTNADIVDFLNVIEMYKFEVVHLYVEHMVDHAIMINETFCLNLVKHKLAKEVVGWMKYIWLAMNTLMVECMKYKWLAVRTGMELMLMNNF